MPIVVALLLLAAIFLFARASKDGAKDPAMSAEERELRRANDESINLIAYLEDPTPAMKAEYVRRHGEWPGYTAKDFQEFEEGARKFNETAAKLKTRYEPTADGRWVLKEGAQPFESTEEPLADVQTWDLAGLPDEVIDRIPYLYEPTEAEKAEYVRRRGSWPGRLEMDPETERKVRIMAARMQLQAQRERDAAERRDDPPGFRPAR